MIRGGNLPQGYVIMPGHYELILYRICPDLSGSPDVRMGAYPDFDAALEVAWSDHKERGGGDEEESPNKWGWLSKKDDELLRGIWRAYQQHPKNADFMKALKPLIAAHKE